MENQILPLINEQIYANNNNLLLELMNKLENLMRDTNDNVVIQRIKDIIIITNKIITNCNQIRQDIQNLNTNLNLRFTSLELKLQNNSSGSANLNNINNNNNFQIRTYNNGRYEGQIINNKREGKGVFISLMAVNMKVIGKMILEKGKESLILLVVTDMKVIIKII